MSVIPPLTVTWHLRAAGGVIRVAGALASLVALMALPGCGCEGAATDTGCPEAGPGTDAGDAGADATTPGTDACPPQTCTVGVECPAGMACIDGACADPAVVACPAATVDWVGAPVAPIVATYKHLEFDDAGVLHVFFQDAAGGLNYGLYGNGEAIVQALPSPCQDAPITVDLSVPGEALLATIGRFCASGEDELAVWTITGVASSATATREVLTGSAVPNFDNFDFHWGSLARTPTGDFFGVDIEDNYLLRYFARIGAVWQEETFSPHNANTVDVAARPDGTVAVLESEGEFRLGTWTPGALSIEYTTMPDEAWGEGPRWLDVSPGAERVLMDDWFAGGVAYGYRAGGVWSRELVPFTRPSWWNLTGTTWVYLPVGARYFPDGELAVGVHTDIEPALKAMYGIDEVAIQIAQRAPGGTWRTDIIHNGGYGGSYDRGPIDIDFGHDPCGRLRVGFVVRDEFSTSSDGIVWIYERH